MKNITTITDIEQCETNGERLKFLMKNNPKGIRFTQEMLSEAINNAPGDIHASPQHISNFISGRGNMSLSLIVVIADILGIKPEDIYADFEDDSSIIKNPWDQQNLWRRRHIIFLKSLGYNINESIDKDGVSIYIVDTGRNELVFSEKQMDIFLKYIDTTVNSTVYNLLYMDGVCRDLFPSDPEIII